MSKDVEKIESWSIDFPLEEITLEMVNYESEDESKKTKNDSKGKNGAKTGSKKARHKKSPRRRKS
jgi:hypothetical protein